MIVHITGYRPTEFPDAPDGFDDLIKYKQNVAERFRKKLELKDTDAVLVDILG